MKADLQNTSNRANLRYPEIDLLRGIAIMAMVVYHGFWNLQYFGLPGFDMTSSTAEWVARTIGSAFLLLVGLSLHISWTRFPARQTRAAVWKKFAIRGAKTWGWALAVTVVTRIVLQGDIFFGILHLIGTAILISPLFLGRPRTASAAGVLVALTGFFTHSVTLESNWLLPFGIGIPGYFMVDYYPLIPWLAPVLLGIGLAPSLYPSATRCSPQRPIAALSSGRWFFWLRFLGRHSLFVYLVHQPILFTLTSVVAHFFT